MKISQLLNSEIEEIINFRGNKIAVLLTPDVYTIKDMTALNEGDAESIAEWVLKGLKGIEAVVGDDREAITLDDGTPIELTVDAIMSLFGATFIRQVMARIESLKVATEGKPKSPKKSQLSSAA